MIDAEISDWLLDSDPALRWQVERDLLKFPKNVWIATKARVATEGVGARLLALQDPDGQWAGGAFFPRDFDFDGPEAQDGAGQPWTATTWTLNSLREWGVDASVLVGTVESLSMNCRWEYDNLPYWGGEVDCCINSWTLSNGLWLGADIDSLVEWFLARQLADGGWNCEWVNGATRSSFHSTLNALKALLDYEIATSDRERVRKARQAGEEYLLKRGLYRRLSTGEAVAPWATRFVYPFRWFYSVLNATDYFRTASIHYATQPDVRIADAIEVIRGASQLDGTWIQEGKHPGRVWFEVDVPAGEPSRWLTFYAIRVLSWWEQRQGV